MEVQPKIRAKVFKLGHSYAILVPKALIDTKILKEDEEYQLTIEKAFFGGLSRNLSNMVNSFTINPNKTFQMPLIGVMAGDSDATMG